MLVASEPMPLGVTRLSVAAASWVRYVSPKGGRSGVAARNVTVAPT